MLYLLVAQKHPIMPPLDAAIFADTGEEPQAVYSHLKWLKTQPGPPIIERNAGNRLGDGLIFGTGPTGYSYMTTKKQSGAHERYASIPAFTLSDNGNIGMTRRQCTKEYKTAVVERTIRRDIIGLKPRQQMPKDVIVHLYMGLSFDEARRVLKVRAIFYGKNQWQAHFPLFDTNTTRAGCRSWLLRQNIPHLVPRSACTFCPYHSDKEWAVIKSVPGDWNRACEVDDALRNKQAAINLAHTSALFVHRSCKPLRDADLSVPEINDRQMEMEFARECEGMCGV